MRGINISPVDDIGGLISAIVQRKNIFPLKKRYVTKSRKRKGNGLLIIISYCKCYKLEKQMKQICANALKYNKVTALTRILN